jgi:hypothetical protein
MGEVADTDQRSLAGQEYEADAVRSKPGAGLRATRQNRTDAARPLTPHFHQAELAYSSVTRPRLLFGSTGMPGPIVVVMVAFLT